MKQCREKLYIDVYSRLMRSAGIEIADLVVRLIKHFYLAPTLQVVGYILNLFESENLGIDSQKLIVEIVGLRDVLQYRRDHDLAQ